MDTNRYGHTGGLADAAQRMHRHRRHRGLAMWLLIGGAVAGVAILAVAGAPPGWIRAIPGVLIVACLLVCVGSAWAESRTVRDVYLAIDRLTARRGNG